MIISSPPADSLYAISVGSVAHKHNSRSLTQTGDPSPFSRIGPGPASVPKPEVVHYGGNCDASGQCRQTGVLAYGHNSQIFESIGTSFSTPLVSTILANVEHRLRENYSPTLAKALVIHSAVLNYWSGGIHPRLLPYFGFGIPMDANDILKCNPWEATMIFQPEFESRLKEFRKTDFPIPSCLRKEDGTVFGEFVMTLVYNPPVNPSAGSEYCQVNIEAALGVIGDDESFKGAIPLEPKFDEKFERYRITNGFKWSPVKVYRARFPRGKTGENWAIRLNATSREGAELRITQPVSLIVSVIDPGKKLPVYNEVIKLMNRSNWVAQDLQVQPRVRIRN